MTTLKFTAPVVTPAPVPPFVAPVVPASVPPLPVGKRRRRSTFSFNTASGHPIRHTASHALLKAPHHRKRKKRTTALSTWYFPPDI